MNKWDDMADLCQKLYPVPPPKESCEKNDKKRVKTKLEWIKFKQKALEEKCLAHGVLRRWQ